MKTRSICCNRLRRKGKRKKIIKGDLKSRKKLKSKKLKKI